MILEQSNFEQLFFKEIVTTWENDFENGPSHLNDLSYLQQRQPKSNKQTNKMTISKQTKWWFQNKQNDDFKTNKMMISKQISWVDNLSIAKRGQFVKCESARRHRW